MIIVDNNNNKRYTNGISFPRSRRLSRHTHSALNDFDPMFSVTLKVYLHLSPFSLKLRSLRGGSYYIRLGLTRKKSFLLGLSTRREGREFPPWVIPGRIWRKGLLIIEASGTGIDEQLKGK